MSTWSSNGANSRPELIPIEQAPAQEFEKWAIATTIYNENILKKAMAASEERDYYTAFSILIGYTGSMIELMITLGRRIRYLELEITRLRGH